MSTAHANVTYIGASSIIIYLPIYDVFIIIYWIPVKIYSRKIYIIQIFYCVNGQFRPDELFYLSSHDNVVRKELSKSELYSQKWCPIKHDITLYNNGDENVRTILFYVFPAGIKFIFLGTLRPIQSREVLFYPHCYCNCCVYKMQYTNLYCLRILYFIDVFNSI